MIFNIITSSVTSRSVHLVGRCVCWWACLLVCLSYIGREKLHPCSYPIFDLPDEKPNYKVARELLQRNIFLNTDKH